MFLGVLRAMQHLRCGYPGYPVINVSPVHYPSPNLLETLLPAVTLVAGYVGQFNLIPSIFCDPLPTPYTLRPVLLNPIQLQATYASVANHPSSR